MSFLKGFKSNKGSTLILYVFAFLSLFACSALVIDIGTVVVERQHLQSSIDAAVLAAAPDLPDTNKSLETATHYIEINGLKASDISVTFSDSNSKINISGTKKINFTFAKILGFSSTNAKCVSSATNESIGKAFDYVLFSGSKTTDLDTHLSTDLTINGSNIFIDGNTHTNANFHANGSKQTITGNCEAVKNITVNGSQINIPNRFPNSEYIPMPDFSETIKAQAIQAGTYYTSSKTYNGSNLNVDTPIYVNGSITVDGSHFSGNGCIVATGDIIFDGSNLYSSSSASVCFYSKSGNIIINGSRAELDGIVYAPRGEITMNGSNQTVHGRVVGNVLTFNGSGLTVVGGSNDLNSLPKSNPKLIK